MALLRDPEVMLLENERQKYCNETHEPTTHQLHRLSASYQLLKEDIHVLHQIKSSSTRQRKITAQINLEKISKLSSSVFTLYSFLVTITEIGKKSYLELIPKLRSWWETVEHPKRLLEKVQLFCELEGIEYIETGRIEAGTICSMNDSLLIRPQYSHRKLFKGLCSYTVTRDRCSNSVFYQANNPIKRSI
jgi:hypothetical protein